MKGYFEVYEELKKNNVINKNILPSRKILAQILNDDNEIIDIGYYIIICNNKIEIIQANNWIYTENFKNILNIPFESDELALKFLIEYPEVYKIITNALDKRYNILSDNVLKLYIKYQIKKYFKKYLTE